MSSRPSGPASRRAVRPSAEAPARPAVRLAALAALARCAGCRRPQPVCVCDRLAPLPAGASPPVVVLRHPGEIDHVLGSAELVAALLPTVRICDGLSWGGWEQVMAAAGLSGDPAAGQGRMSPGRWGVLWPLGWPSDAPPPPPGAMQAWPPRGDPQAAPTAGLAGLVVLDGTWRQAKTLWWRNAWLLSLTRLRLTPATPNAFGRLRQAPSPGHLSTLETVAAALEALQAPPDGPRALRRVLRTLVQRVRDWTLPEGA